MMRLWKGSRQVARPAVELGTRPPAEESARLIDLEAQVAVGYLSPPLGVLRHTRRPRPVEPSGSSRDPIRSKVEEVARAFLAEIGPRVLRAGPGEVRAIGLRHIAGLGVILDDAFQHHAIADELSGGEAGNFFALLSEHCVDVLVRAAKSSPEKLVQLVSSLSVQNPDSFATACRALEQKMGSVIRSESALAALAASSSELAAILSQVAPENASKLRAALGVRQAKATLAEAAGLGLAPVVRDLLADLTPQNAGDELTSAWHSALDHGHGQLAAELLRPALDRLPELDVRRARESPTYVDAYLDALLAEPAPMARLSNGSREPRLMTLLRGTDAPAAMLSAVAEARRRTSAAHETDVPDPFEAKDSQGHTLLTGALVEISKSESERPRQRARIEALLTSGVGKTTVGSSGALPAHLAARVLAPTDPDFAIRVLWHLLQESPETVGARDEQAHTVLATIFRHTFKVSPRATLALIQIFSEEDPARWSALARIRHEAATAMLSGVEDQDGSSTHAAAALEVLGPAPPEEANDWTLPRVAIRHLGEKAGDAVIPVLEALGRLRFDIDDSELLLRAVDEIAKPAVRRDVVRRLLDRGVAVSARAIQGQTVLHRGAARLIKSQAPEDLQVIRDLLDAPARAHLVTVRTTSRHSALDILDRSLDRDAPLIAEARALLRDFGAEVQRTHGENAV